QDNSAVAERGNRRDDECREYGNQFIDHFFDARLSLKRKRTECHAAPPVASLRKRTMVVIPTTRAALLRRPSPFVIPTTLATLLRRAPPFVILTTRATRAEEGPRTASRHAKPVPVSWSAAALDRSSPRPFRERIEGEGPYSARDSSRARLKFCARSASCDMLAFSRIADSALMLSPVTEGAK